MCIYCYFERGDDILLRRDQNVEPAYANIELDRRGAEGRVDVQEKGGAARERRLARDDVRHNVMMSFAKERGARPTPRFPHPLRL